MERNEFFRKISVVLLLALTIMVMIPKTLSVYASAPEKDKVSIYSMDDDEIKFIIKIIKLIKSINSQFLA